MKTDEQTPRAKTGRDTDPPQTPISIISLFSWTHRQFRRVSHTETQTFALPNPPKASPPRPKPSLDRSPVEIIYATLLKLHDIESFTAAIQICRSLLSALYAHATASFLIPMLLPPPSPEAAAALKIPVDKEIYKAHRSFLKDTRKFRSQNSGGVEDILARPIRLNGHEPRDLDRDPDMALSQICKVMGIDRGHSDPIDSIGGPDVWDVVRTCKAHRQLFEMYKADPTPPLERGLTLTSGSIRLEPPSLEKLQASCGNLNTSVASLAMLYGTGSGVHLYASIKPLTRSGWVVRQRKSPSATIFFFAGSLRRSLPMLRGTLPSLLCRIASPAVWFAFDMLSRIQETRTRAASSYLIEPVERILFCSGALNRRGKQELETVATGPQNSRVAPE